MSVRSRGEVYSVKTSLTEYGRQGAINLPPSMNVPTIVTPRATVEDAIADWAEGGVQIYDTPTNTNQMQYHVMIPVKELWQYCNRFYRGTKNEFDNGYEMFIRQGANSPVYISLGQNGRAKVTGNEDLVWFAKKSGLKELPVFFSYQKQV